MEYNLLTKRFENVTEDDANEMLALLENTLNGDVDWEHPFWLEYAKLNKVNPSLMILVYSTSFATSLGYSAALFFKDNK